MRNARNLVLCFGLVMVIGEMVIESERIVRGASVVYGFAQEPSACRAVHVEKALKLIRNCGLVPLLHARLYDVIVPVEQVLGILEFAFVTDLYRIVSVVLV